jgi:hypothetical protein
MNDQRFDDLTRMYANEVSRRDFLKLISNIFMGIVFTSVAASCSKNDPGCSIGSTCDDKHFCSDDQSCRCIKSAEGAIRCGRAPSCDTKKCKTSADCAVLGAGYFCDTPNSGCCNDAGLQRCVPPCTCPTNLTCGSECCEEGQNCVDGTCTEIGVTCPSCGKCTACKPDQGTGATNCGPCDDSCTAAQLCSEANQDEFFLKLTRYLRYEGYTLTGESQAGLLYDENQLARSVFAVVYAHSSRPGETVQLAYRKDEASGETDAFALVFSNKKAIHGYGIGGNGEVQQVEPPPPATPSAIQHPLSLISYHHDSSSCSLPCGLACGIIAETLCIIATGLICSPAGPAGILICELSIGLMCQADSIAACYVICEQGICKEKTPTPTPAPKTYYCGCNNTCYDSASACTAECQVTLGCFASEICSEASTGQC